ncbi:uncharacterized protein DUF1850 [Albidovulum inexpectatum]|uniref:Uncharacterized protein DUF1850 n=1 Tax=Albidovulum inexpectatum TaxID=196587 RepID=A0A2S5JI39_9RHOB|nr:DUF1850 domain-containing protein [Albidovulum inexpectatum]PPB81194.1 uncharacterized protein DUF1850 [Albidovulum inexpectatum]
MSGACLLVGASVLMLGATEFDLRWTHSVEHTEWWETWQVEGRALRLIRAAVKGSGAGMDPGEGAKLRDGWWVWQVDLPPQEELLLAASGATGAGWKLCDMAGCRELGAQPGQPLRIAPCPAD